ncbi:MAG: hypothetical protein DMH00_06910 [Acidobacteria bacterium]|nr:MAG: hypothetical protein DMH00_06910 [Acidobacteriota bacterium]
MGVPSHAATLPSRRSGLLFLALAVALFFYPVLLGEGVFYFRDISLNHYPTRIYASAEIKAGHFPLWNPYLSGGMPLAADPNNLILHPITLLFLALPVPAAFTAAILLQFLLAAWGMLLWGEAEGLQRKSALMSALAFTFSGPLASCGSLLNLLSSWAWVPLALFALARHRRTGSRIALAGYAVFLAVQLLAGDPVAAGTTVMVGLILTVAEEPGLRRPEARRLLAPLAGALLACGLALVAILPAREMLSVSSRAKGIPYREALTWSVSPIRTLEMVVPSLYGDPTALKPSSYWGGMIFEKGYPFLLSLYLGVVPVLLALAALLRRPRGKTVALGCFTVFAVLASLGGTGAVYPLLYRYVPLVDSLRYPSRFMLCGSLGIALLAGMGMERLGRFQEESLADRTGMRLAIVASLLVGTLALGAASIPGLLPRLAHEGLGLPASMGAETLTQIAAALRTSFVRCGVLATAFGALLRAARRGWLRTPWCLSLILLGAGGDLLSANLHLNPVVDATFYHAHPPAADLVERDRVVERVYAEPRPPGFAVLAASDSAWWGYYWDEISCRVATCLPWRIPMTFDRSTDLLSPASLNTLGEAMKSLDAVRVRKLCDLASVGLLQTYRDLSDPALSPVGRLTRQTSVPLRLYRNRNPLPRAYMVSRAVPARGSSLQSLTRDDWDPRDSVILDGIPGPCGSPHAAGSVEWLAQEPGRLELQVAAAITGWVVITDNHYPGWIAEMDGARVPILRANFLFRAVEVPPGDHRLTLHYAPRAWIYGGIGTVCTILLMSFWVLAGRRGRS